MTLSATSWAWEKNLSPEGKLLLLLLADVAGDMPFSFNEIIGPAVEKTGMTRQVIASLFDYLYASRCLFNWEHDSYNLWTPEADIRRGKSIYEEDDHAPEQEICRHPGYVYLIQADSGHYKIGRSREPENRLKTFGVQLPFEIEFIHLIQTNDMCELEKELHEKFESKRVNGEWFSLSPEDVAYIKSLGGEA